MSISAPATRNKLMELRKAIPYITEELDELYKLSEGLEIEVSGTQFYSVEKILAINSSNKKHGLEKDLVLQGKGIVDWIRVQQQEFIRVEKL